jgi:tRNA(adenine34) deaminase
MTDEEWMDKALMLAKKAAEEGEIPVGALIVREGRLIGRGHNRREKKKDVSSHAEIEALRKAEKKLQNWRLDKATIYVTLEPCLMCAGAILQARLGRVVYGAADPKEGALVSKYFVYDAPTLQERPLVKGGVKAQECEALLADFFAQKRKRI